MQIEPPLSVGATTGSPWAFNERPYNNKKPCRSRAFLVVVQNLCQHSRIFGSTNWNLEYSLIVLFLYCNNAAHTDRQAYDKYSNGKYNQIFKQSYNATK